MYVKIYIGRINRCAYMHIGVRMSICCAYL